jgi:hypothetical protein
MSKVLRTLYEKAKKLEGKEIAKIDESDTALLILDSLLNLHSN